MSAAFLAQIFRAEVRCRFVALEEDLRVLALVLGGSEIHDEFAVLNGRIGVRLAVIVVLFLIIRLAVIHVAHAAPNRTHGHVAIVDRFTSGNRKV